MLEELGQLPNPIVIIPKIGQSAAKIPQKHKLNNRNKVQRLDGFGLVLLRTNLRYSPLVLEIIRIFYDAKLNKNFV